ncbi:MAG: cation:proton antiporter, partial [Candidatus Scalindua sp.]|nr:cation:proton antiporter [Candidatus Scalindua sp.]
LSDVKEIEIFTITSPVMRSTHSSSERDPLVQEEEGAQTSKGIDIQQGNNADDESVSFLQEEKSSTNLHPIDSEETDQQESVKVLTEGDEVKSTWEIWHTDPTQSIILAVVITLIVAKLGGWIARVLGFPGVVGKLILGMILGNIYLLTGSDYFEFLKTMPFLKMLSYFGTLVLLLTAGLHTDLRAIFRVGPSSVLVCLGGMVVPAGLGLIVSHFLLPDSSTGSKVLLSIILCSTSTGLLFAILNELKIMHTIEGRVIVGATILTEIIVILSFGIVSGIVVKGGVSLIGISVSFGVAIFLLITAVVIIFKYGERFGNFLTNRLTEGLNIPIIVILSLLMAFMFGSIGLHTVIGAFIAGLFLRNVRLRNSDEDEHRNVESFIRPFYALLVPILFLRVGAQVDLQSFLNLNAILLGLNITGAAILGKLFCGICPIEKGTNRLLIGFGMAMKLEGTLILAGIGRDVGIFDDTVFSSIIMSIVFTSTICPFLMKKLLFKKNNTGSESICIDPEKTELVKAPLNKHMRLKIFGYLI